MCTAMDQLEISVQNVMAQDSSGLKPKHISVCAVMEQEQSHVLSVIPGVSLNVRVAKEEAT